mmetsp:Transcript_29704/g.89396  ORF Transcript_29704/g.89396 Transcript_29704/m.89396 type:complete len:94 (-) Transcript_29704:17-298(-)
MLISSVDEFVELHEVDMARVRSSGYLCSADEQPGQCCCLGDEEAGAEGGRCFAAPEDHTGWSDSEVRPGWGLGLPFCVACSCPGASSVQVMRV